MTEDKFTIRRWHGPTGSRKEDIWEFASYQEALDAYQNMTANEPWYSYTLTYIAETVHLTWLGDERMPK